MLSRNKTSGGHGVSRWRNEFNIDMKKIIHKDLLKVYTDHKELRPSRGQESEICMTKVRGTIYEERIEIVSYCIEHGKDYIVAIQKYGISYQQIYSWVRRE